MVLICNTLLLFPVNLSCISSVMDIDELAIISIDVVCSQAYFTFFFRVVTVFCMGRSALVELF